MNVEAIRKQREKIRASITDDMSYQVRKLAVSKMQIIDNALIAIARAEEANAAAKKAIAEVRACV